MGLEMGMGKGGYPLTQQEGHCDHCGQRQHKDHGAILRTFAGEIHASPCIAGMVRLWFGQSMKPFWKAHGRQVKSVISEHRRDGFPSRYTDSAERATVESERME